MRQKTGNAGRAEAQTLFAMSDDNNAVENKVSATSRKSDSMVAARSDLSLDPRPDYLAYKTVRWCTRRDGGDIDRVYALLHMQIPGSASIFESISLGKQVRTFPPLDGLRDAAKYCTNHLRVIGVQFFGDSHYVASALIDYQMSRGFLLSGWSGSTRYEYELERDHYEPNAGRAGDSGCLSGLHFFRDIESALRYGQFHDRKQWKTEPVVARRLQHGRGLVYPILDKDLLDEDAKKRGAFVQVAEVTSLRDETVPRFDWKVSYRLVSFLDRLAAKANDVDNGSKQHDDPVQVSDDNNDEVGYKAAVEECPICFDDGLLVALPCHKNHQFCQDCIDAMQFCPVCRFRYK